MNSLPCLAKSWPIAMHLTPPTYSTMAATLDARRKLENNPHFLTLTLGMLLVVYTVLFFTHPTLENNKNYHQTYLISAKACKSTHIHNSELFYQYHPGKSKTLLTLIIIIAGDVELTSGTNTSICPCAICEYPVNWSQYSIACDGCNISQILFVYV